MKETPCIRGVFFRLKVDFLARNQDCRKVKKSKTATLS